MRAASIVLLSVWVAALLQAQAPAPAAQNPAPATPPAQAPPPAQGGGRQGSPASQRPPQTVTPQTYPPEQIRAGQVLFAVAVRLLPRPRRDGRRDRPRPHARRCSSPRTCAATRSVRSSAPAGRTRGCRPSPCPTRTSGVVAFIHDQKRKADIARRRPPHASTSPICRPATPRRASGTSTGPAAARMPFAPTGDLAGLATRLQGLALLQRMLYPAAAGAAAGAVRADGDRDAAAGEAVTGKLAYRDEFTIALTDANGWYRSWPTRR